MRVLLVAVAAAMALGACSENEQVVVYKQGKYQGKPDNRAWDNGPLADEWRGSKWKQGDRASWEEAIRNRQLAQHEHRRIYQ